MDSDDDEYVTVRIAVLLIIYFATIFFTLCTPENSLAVVEDIYEENPAESINENV